METAPKVRAVNALIVCVSLDDGERVNYNYGGHALADVNKAKIRTMQVTAEALRLLKN